MRILKQLPILSVVDAVLFLLTYGIRALGTGPLLYIADVFYFIAMFTGLVLAIIGFISLKTSGESGLKRSVVSVLFSLVPACVGLITILTHLGTPVGGAHLS